MQYFYMIYVEIFLPKLQKYAKIAKLRVEVPEASYLFQDLENLKKQGERKNRFELIWK